MLKGFIQKNVILMLDQGSAYHNYHHRNSMHSTSFNQVFDNSRVRECELEMLYPTIMHLVGEAQDAVAEPGFIPCRVNFN